ncbi:MAG: hypothetical protein VW396_01910, partial [Ilumatobacter sp.]
MRLAVAAAALLAALIPASTAASPDGSPDGTLGAQALDTFSIDFDPVGTIGSLGVEWTYTGDWSDSPFGYDVYMRWDASGRWFTWETDTTSL